MTIPTRRHALPASPSGPAEKASHGEHESRSAYKAAPVQYAPLVPAFLSVAKWAFGFPGFLWPWNLIWLCITVTTYKFTNPAIEEATALEMSWIWPMLARNLVLLWVVCGGWHGYLYIAKANGTEKKYNPSWPKPDPKHLFGDQTYENLFYSHLGWLVWTAYEVFFMHMWATGRLPYYSDWFANPWYSLAWLIAIPFWREFHFYWVHRLIHWKPLYKYVHSLHHRNVNPGPWSGLSMHPVELVLYFSVVLFPSAVFPLHPIHMLFNAQHTALTPAAGHSGFDLAGAPWYTGSTFHYLHHR